MATSRFVQITDKEINKIKINSILKNTKDPTINNILGLQIISRKNITLVYKDGQLFLIYSLECVKY